MAQTASICYFRLATAILSQAMLEQRHKQAIDQLEKEMSAEMQRQMDDLHNELQQELQGELDVSAKGCHHVSHF